MLLHFPEGCALCSVESLHAKTRNWFWAKHIQVSKFHSLPVFIESGPFSTQPWHLLEIWGRYIYRTTLFGASWFYVFPYSSELIRKDFYAFTKSFTRLQRLLMLPAFKPLIFHVYLQLKIHQIRSFFAKVEARLFRLYSPFVPPTVAIKEKVIAYLR